MPTPSQPGSAPPTTKLQPFDRIILAALQLYGLAALICLALVPHFFLPAEDAVILFQYSRNLAQTGAITFLKGGPHVEGATDFAWMLLVAAASRCGIPEFWFCAIVNVLALIGLAIVLLRLAKLRLSIARILTIAGAAALFPQFVAAAAGFAVLPDAFLLTLLAMYVTERRPRAAALTALALCLFRPDAIVFALPLLLSLLLAPTHRRQTMAAILAFFAAPGTLYFLWRWHYFAEVFPLPFLVKASTHRLLGLVVPTSVRTSLVFLLFAALVLFLSGIFRNRSNRSLILALIVVPSAFYWAMRLDQNVGYRFFYYLPLATAILLAVNWPQLLPRRKVLLRSTTAAWLILLAMPLYREVRTFRDLQFGNIQSIASDLARLSPHGTIITSEAGFLPYYSGWTTYDAWGLNTAEFAHRFFQPSDVPRLAPDLVVLHPDRAESCIRQPDWEYAYPDRSWPSLTRNLVTGADPGQYELWLVSYGSEFYRNRKHWQYGEGDRECWLLRRDSTLHNAMTKVLKQHHGVPPAEALLLETAHKP